MSTSPGVQKFSIGLVATKGSTIELIDVEFDEVVNEGIAFIPDEFRTIKFKNSSPLDQLQDVTISKEKSVSVTTLPCRWKQLLLMKFPLGQVPGS